jgi:hypothetical protein
MNNTYNIDIFNKVYPKLKHTRGDYKMKITSVRRNHVLAAVALVLLFSLSAQIAYAMGTFNVTVAHKINGRSLGLSKDLPVNITIVKDGEFLAEITDFRFGEKFSTPLPSGEYLITVESVEAGPLPSMTVGPVEIPEGANLFLVARLSADKTPIVSVRAK